MHAHPFYEIIRYDRVDSTNRIALELSDARARSGTVIVARQQDGGRGRLGKTFASPDGGLYFSLVLRPRLEPEQLSFLTIVAGYGCGLAIEVLSGLNLRLKWPNDLYVGSLKIGGILTEVSPVNTIHSGDPVMVIGIGLNVNSRLEHFPPPLRETVTTLYYETKQTYNLELLLEDLVGRLLVLCEDPESRRTEILTWWRRRDMLAGARVTWHKGDASPVFGIGVGLLDDGCYGLRTSTGQEFSVSGGSLELQG